MYRYLSLGATGVLSSSVPNNLHVQSEMEKKQKQIFA